MARAFLAFLLVVAMVVVATAAEQHSCGEYEEWTSCGSACPPTCNADPHRACTLQCVQGCQCKQGYSRHSGGNCVLTENC